MKSEARVEVRRYTDVLTKFETGAGIPVKETYTPEDLEGFDYERDLGKPGEFPYTRHLYRQGYRKLPWLKSQIVCQEDAAEANRNFKELIASGQTGLRLLADYPTNLGIDPDHPLAVKDIGCSGVPCWSLQCMEEYLKDIPLENVDAEFAYPGPHCTLVMWGQMVAVAENRGLDISKLRGTTMNCVMSTHGTHLYHDYPVPLGRRINTDFIEFCTKYTPRWHPIVPNTNHIGESGANAVEQLACVLASAIAYCEDAINRGIDFDSFAPRMVFSMTCEIDFFETMCKLRAVRRMWAKIAKERFKAKKPESCKVRLASRTAGVSLTRQQPVNNITRIAYEALASVLGGANSIDLAGYDEAYVIPGFEAHLINLNIHHILAHETGAAITADPLGGSYYVEWLTNKLESEANKLLCQIEEMGGMYEALEKGWFENLFREGMIRWQREVTKGEKLLIGVNKYKVPEEQPELPMPAPVYVHHLEEAAQRNLEKIKELREERDIGKTKEALERLYYEAKDNKNLIRPVIEACKADATIGEILGVIREAMGYSYDHFDMVHRPAFLTY